jgi:hypothetical protein
MDRSLLRHGVTRLSSTGKGASQPSLLGRLLEEDPPRPLSGGRPAFRPAVEALETRLTPAVTFTTQQTFAAGTEPDAVAWGDFNGDGRPDLVVANYFDKTVSVLLDTTPAGAGTPSFAAPQTFAAAGNPAAVAVADFNGDGRADLAVANSQSNTVAVLRNATAAGAGTPSFAAPQTFAVGTNPRAMAWGDFNGDGRPDLTVVNDDDKTVSVLLNTTAAGVAALTFAAQQTFAVGPVPEGVAVGDVNGDGRPDLAVANEIDNTVSVLRNQTAAGAATPSFAARQTFAVGTNANGVAWGDFNGDGRPDLVVANYGANFIPKSVSVLLNKTPAGGSTPTFAAQQTFAVESSPRSVAVGDFDGDGRPDLAVPNYVTNTVSVLRNQTAAGATSAAFAAQQTFAVGTQPFAVAVADFNGDGRPDLATANFNSKTASVLLDTTAPFTSAAPVVVGQFGTQGVWEFNRTSGTWVQLTPANASVLAADPQGDVAASFPGYGVWLFKPAGGWAQIGGGDAAALAMDALGDVAGSFPGAGVWLYRPAAGFKQIGGGDAAVLTMDAQGDVAGTFPGHGVWLYRPVAGFKQIGGGDASALAMDAQGDVVGSFPGAGVWLYRPATGFQQIGTADASILALDALGDVVGSFRGAGVWEYRPAAGFRQIGTSDAAALGMDALGEVFGSFAGAGVWEFDPYRGWVQRAPSDARVLAVA